MKTKLGLGLVALGIVVLLPLTSWAQSGPFFGTFLPNGQPEDTFSPSENLLLKGGNWGANKKVDAVFDQNPTFSMGTSVTDSQGDFTMLTNIPGSALNGPAVVTVAVSFATGTVTRSQPVHIIGAGVGGDSTDDEDEEDEDEDEDDDAASDRGAGAQQQQQQQGEGDGQQQQSGRGDGQQQQQQQQVVNVASTKPARSSKLPATGTEAGLMGGTGFSLILLGLGLLAWSGRRRRNPLRPPPPWSLLPPGAQSPVWVSRRPRPPLPASLSRSLPALPPGPPDDSLVEADILALSR